MRCICILLLAVFTANNILHAQNTHFMQQGVIEFEKTVNIHGLFKKNYQELYGQSYVDYIKSKPQFKKLKSTLRFSNNIALFVPEEDRPEQGFEDPIVPQINTVFTDIAKGKIISQKKVFEETFLLKDSVRKINWKITDEFREIAGYNCRRANAIIMDSIYVVAFYAEEILVSGGPESFSGLPGMILGVALPHDNITWFATSVKEIHVAATELVPPSKGKAVTKKQLEERLKPVLEEWWDGGGQGIKAFSL